MQEETPANRNNFTISSVLVETPGNQKDTSCREHEVTPADEVKKEVSDSTYLQICAEVEQQLAQTTFERQLCQELHVTRLYDVEGFKSLKSSSKKAKAEPRLLTVNAETRSGFIWRYTTRGYLSDARRETKGSAQTREERSEEVFRQHRRSVHMRPELRGPGREAGRPPPLHQMGRVGRFLRALEDRPVADIHRLTSSTAM